MILGAKQSTIKKLMFMGGVVGGKPVEESVTGNPARFFTDLAKPLRSMIIPFYPVQSGTGDPSPENIRPITGWTGVTAWRTGKNLLPTQETIRSGSTTYIGSSEYWIPLKAGTYTMSEDGNLAYLYWRKEGTTDNNIIHTSASHSGSFTLEEDSYIRFWYYAVSNDATYSNIMLNAGNTALPYESYTGQSYPVTFPAVGKNLLDLSILRQGNFDGTVNQNNVTFDEFLPIKGGLQYVWSTDISDISGRYLRFYDATKTIMTGTSVSMYGSGEKKFTAPENACYFRAMWYRNGGLLLTDITKDQIELGSTATAYEPFTNTVYGGTLDAVSRVLTVDRALVDLGTLTWASDPNRLTVKFTRSLSSSIFKTSPWADAICSEYALNKNGPDSISSGQFSTTNAYGAGNVFFKDDAFSEMTNDEVKEYLSGVQLAYELATPIEIPLDSISIRTLLGDNTIWTDTNGENAITFLKKG